MAASKGFPSSGNPVIPKPGKGTAKAASVPLVAKWRQWKPIAYALDWTIETVSGAADLLGLYVKALQPVTRGVRPFITGALDPLASRTLVGKPPKRTVLTEFIAAGMADTRGYALGGVILSIVDIAAGLCAHVHGELPAVTASVDAVHLVHPIRCGELAIVSAMPTRAWSSSMEIVVDVEAENLQTGRRSFCCRAYLTFVALKDGRPARVPPIAPATPEEQARFDAADERRKLRLQRRGLHYESFKEVLSQYQQQYYASIDPPAAVPSYHEQVLDSRGPAVVKRGGSGASARARPAAQSLFSDASKAADAPVRPESPTSLPGPLVAVGTLSSANKANTIEATYCEMVQIILPQHANTYQITFGGNILKWIEGCAHVSASRHARAFISTASLDDVRFRSPTYVGDGLTIRSIVSCAFQSSMEVYVTVERQDGSGNKSFTNEAFITMVAVDEHGAPVPVPRLHAQSRAEEELMQAARQRKQRRDESRLKVRDWARLFDAEMARRSRQLALDRQQA